MGVGALVGKRVSLRVVRHADVAGVEAWYNEAARLAYEERSFEELRATTEELGGVFALAKPEADEPIGLMEYRRDGEWLAIPFIALAKAYRGWGYGLEAVRLLEEWAVREEVAKRFRVEVDVRNGLGLYFWLRLGYRPEVAITDGEGRGLLAMVREGAELR